MGAWYKHGMLTYGWCPLEWLYPPVVGGKGGKFQKMKLCNVQNIREGQKMQTTLHEEN